MVSETGGGGDGRESEHPQSDLKFSGTDVSVGTAVRREGAGDQSETENMI